MVCVSLAAVIVVVAVIAAVVVAVIAATSDEPICPAGQDYVFSHNIVVGQLTVPQYVCR